MALAKFIQKSNSIVLRLQLPPTFVPAATYCYKYEQPKEKKGLWWKLFGWTTKEYDEEGNELGFPNEDDLAVGMWKKEIEARKAGITDPFDMGAINRGEKGTKFDPIRVPSALPSRIICCRCSPDSFQLYPMWLHQNEPARCRCGFWIILYYKPPFVEYTPE